ncbi:fimbrial protein [Enterobacillus tribolii]|uniref:Major type 1 subunit fimbrin (Pilin) n=1 Tax=Enterobacillus tribolii TaxID=1487935 RepID=A0A370R2B2_9GAMM|nr:fimbrial protein [Enterobacillus tribolii]MBW7984859.1 type 1 fimbrial protein [Enterobacillus tribolii]RDK96051.1 major type 1 subunit fimbrin (pilin) [Enterobacillus tribolii]
MRNFKLAICALAMSAVSTAAFAEGQGQVRFEGELINETCKLADDSKDILVTLPKLSTKTLDAEGKEAGSKGFDINVIDCPSSITKVAAHFEAIGSSGVNSATGNLKNAYTAADKAGNVEVRLYDADESHLKLGDTGQSFTVKSDGTSTLRYYGGYYATAATTAGKVEAKALFTLAYE